MIITLTFEFHSQTVSMENASPLEPTPPTSESDSSGEITMATTTLILYCAQFVCYALITLSQCTQCSTACVHSDNTPPSPSLLSPGSSLDTSPSVESASGSGVRNGRNRAILSQKVYGELVIHVDELIVSNYVAVSINN